MSRHCSGRREDRREERGFREFCDSLDSNRRSPCGIGGRCYIIVFLTRLRGRVGAGDASKQRRITLPVQTARWDSAIIDTLGSSDGIERRLTVLRREAVLFRIPCEGGGREEIAVVAP